MRKVVLLLVLLGNIFYTYGNSFEFSKVDSLNLPKNEIYSLTKMFIADYWNSAKNVIQNEDKEIGLIQVKGLKKLSASYLLIHYCDYYYGYSIRFRIKENKCMIEIYNIQCESAYADGVVKIPLIQPFEDSNIDSRSLDYRLSKNKAKQMMTDLKIALQKIVSDYSTFITAQSTSLKF